MPSRAPKPSLDFEQAIHRLEEVVERLERGDLPLEEGLAAFEEGVGLAQACQQKLEEAEKRIETLVTTPPGQASNGT
ncbi:MAG: exodeoxyribonuclease VII small subunit [Magnetococcales bacterium]|nr:exodeoxyribonuclease VII small subunit [Magnetococcales bacterium]